MGRRLDLKFDSSNSMKFSFNTMQQNLGGSDVLNIPLKNLYFKFHGAAGNIGSTKTLMAAEKTIEIPYKEVSFKLNFNECGSLNIATEDSTSEISFLMDRNRLFATKYEESHTNNEPENNASLYDIYCPNGKVSTVPASYKGTWICPQLDCHVERLNRDDNFNLNFNLKNYSHSFQGKGRDQTIIEVELHIYNSKNANINIKNPQFPYIAFQSSADDLANGRFTVTSLTDIDYIEPQKTNVYVYRIDTYRLRIVRSLAYIF